MSRTYRHKGSSKYRLKEDVLICWERVQQEDKGGDYIYSWFGRVSIDPRSDKGKKLKAKFHADSNSIMIWNGKSWFNRLYSQVPYRMRAKKEVHKFLRNNEYEIVIENKPHREYYW